MYRKDDFSQSLNRRAISGLNQTIVKSMSDVDCYKSRTAPLSIKNNLNITNNDFELIVPKFELDANQATVGHGRGEWAKEIFGGKKKSDQQINEKDVGNSSKNSSSSDRVSLASMFLREEISEPSSFEIDKFKRMDSNSSETGLYFDTNKPLRKETDHLTVKENDDATASTSTIKDEESIASAFCKVYIF